MKNLQGKKIHRRFVLRHSWAIASSLLFLCCKTTVFSQTTVVSYDFNSSDNGWTPTSSINGAWTRGNALLNEGSDGTDYWYLSGYSNGSIVVLTRDLAGNIDLSGQTDLVLSMDIRYDTEQGNDGFQMQYSSDGGSNWFVLGAVGDGFNWYNDTDVDGIGNDEDGWSGDNQGWQTAYIGLPAILENNASVQFRLVFNSNATVTDVGVAFDNFKITSGGVEILVSSNGDEIVDGDLTPSESDGTDFGSAVTSSGSRLRTFGITNINGATLSLTGGNPVTISGAHASDFSVVQPTDLMLDEGESTTFTITFNPSATGLRTATVSIASNDSNENPYNFDLQGYGLVVVDAASYTFDSGDQGWTAGTSTNGSWSRGTAIFGEGANGSYWHTSPTTNYNPNAMIELVSPTINMTGITGMILYMDIRYETEEGFDGWNVEYSDNNGSTWTDLGMLGSGINWYNDTDVDAFASGVDGWSGNNLVWQTAEIELPAALNGNSDTRFRVVFESDNILNELGVAFDNFMIGAAVADIQVGGNGNEIADGSTTASIDNTTDLRNVDVTEGMKSVVYTIINRGGSTLNLTGATPVTLSGTHASDFSVTSQPALAALGYLEQTTFTIQFDPSVTGQRFATVNIASDDGDEGTFDFQIGGTGDNAIQYYGFDVDGESWTVTANNNGNWLYGNAILSTGASGSYWHTDPSNYSNNGSVILQSPQIDLSSATDPFLSVDVRYDTESGLDGVKIEYSSDDGANWFDLGQVGSGINWYNDSDLDGFATGEDGWSGDNGNWLTSELLLPSALAGNSQVRFRVMFASNASGVDVGAAFDNFAIYGDEMVLPVDLLDFIGVSDNGAVALRWSTASEINNDFFIVQHSKDGLVFRDIAKINGNGTVNIHSKYSYIDKGRHVGDKNYYRLKQVDYDGSSELHPVISVLVDNDPAEDNLEIYPNPIASGQSMNLVVTSHNSYSTRLDVAIIDMLGKLQSHLLLDTAEDGKYEIDQLPSDPGLYMIVIRQGVNRMVKRFVIKK